MTIIPSIPNNLQDGTVADAVPVMGNFNAILTAVNANAAHNGANTDITSLSGLTTPLSQGQGGTGTTSLALALGQLRGYLGGLTLSNDSGTPNTILDISAGICADSTATILMSLGAFTKTTGAWTSGSGGGGLDTGSVAASTWYHVYVIAGSAVTTDVLFSTGVNPPTALPAGYTFYRRIGSFKTNASSNIIAFSQNGDEFLWLTQVVDVNVSNLGAVATAYALSVPPGVKVNALLAVGIAQASANVEVQVFSPDQTTSGFILITQVASQQVYGYMNVRTNTSGQIKAVSGSASTTLVVVTNGWVDTRGRFA